MMRSTQTPGMWRDWFVRALAGGVLIGGALTGCTLEPGNSWGEIGLAAQVRFAPDKDRLSEKGELLTVNNEAVQWTELSVTPEQVTARWSPQSVETDFDPANPPPGYSLCHSGHCHKDDGTLPTYDQIKAELARSSPGGVEIAWRVTQEASLDVAAEPKLLALADCVPSCEVARGAVGTWTVALHGVRIAGRVRSTSSNGPLPTAHEFVVELDRELTVSSAANVRFDRDHGPIAQVSLTLDLPATLLDDVSFAQAMNANSNAYANLSDMATVTTAIAQRIESDSTVTSTEQRTF